MKLIVILVIGFALLFAGCMEQEKSSGNKRDALAGSSEPTGAGSPVKMKVIITSPGAGQIIQGKEDISFDGSAEGGEGKLSYEWSSSINGRLSTSRSFKYNPTKLEKGGHVIILKVTDERGRSGEGSVLVEVM
ncbi:PKD domain-containing protein [Methanothrix sp.]|uniref:PKD domain-containing protein n=1 Tax=Methanothrix sp. TaxID=90426 RepID=UPI003C78F466